MNIKTWLEARAGRSTAMAKHFGRTQSAICQWKTNGVPRSLIRDVLAFTGGEVSLNDMVPPSDPYSRQRITAA